MGIRDGQRRLRKIATNLDYDKVSEKDKCFLINALIKIANGEDAELALNVKAKRGERKGVFPDEAKIRKQLVNSWIRVAKSTISNGGLGLTSIKAVDLIKPQVKDLPSSETLVRYWSTDKDNYSAKGFNINWD